MEIISSPIFQKEIHDFNSHVRSEFLNSERDLHDSTTECDNENLCEEFNDYDDWDDQPDLSSIIYQHPACKIPPKSATFAYIIQKKEHEIQQLIPSFVVLVCKPNLIVCAISNCIAHTDITNKFVNIHFSPIPNMLTDLTVFNTHCVNSFSTFTVFSVNADIMHLNFSTIVDAITQRHMIVCLPQSTESIIDLINGSTLKSNDYIIINYHNNQLCALEKQDKDALTNINLEFSLTVSNEKCTKYNQHCITDFIENRPFSKVKPIPTQPIITRVKIIRNKYVCVYQPLVHTFRFIYNRESLVQISLIIDTITNQLCLLHDFQTLTPYTQYIEMFDFISECLSNAHIKLHTPISPHDLEMAPVLPYFSNNITCPIVKRTNDVMPLTHVAMFNVSLNDMNMLTIEPQNTYHAPKQASKELFVMFGNGQTKTVAYVENNNTTPIATHIQTFNNNKSTPDFKLNIFPNGKFKVIVDNMNRTKDGHLIMWKGVKHNATPAVAKLLIPPTGLIDTFDNIKYRVNTCMVEQIWVIDHEQKYFCHNPKCSHFPDVYDPETTHYYCVNHATHGKSYIPLLAKLFEDGKMKEVPNASSCIMNTSFTYTVGQTLTEPMFEARNESCGIGIHGFIDPINLLSYCFKNENTQVLNYTNEVMINPDYEEPTSLINLADHLIMPHNNFTQYAITQPIKINVTVEDITAFVDTRFDANQPNGILGLLQQLGDYYRNLSNDKLKHTMTRSVLYNVRCWPTGGKAETKKFLLGWQKKTDNDFKDEPVSESGKLCEPFEPFEPPQQTPFKHTLNTCRLRKKYD
jgi:hypothetical protein